MDQLNKERRLVFLKLKKFSDNFMSHPFKILQPAVKTVSMSLFHLDDLAASKAYTIGRRNTWRDYVDLFILMKRNIYSLKRIIELAKQKFNGEFNEKLFLGQLSYFNDVDTVPTNFIKKSYTDNEIKSFLEAEVSQYAKKTILK